MNFFASILLLFVVVSCSKPGSSPIGGAASEIDKNIVIFEEIQISVPLTGIPAAPVSLDFASLAYKQSGVQDLVLYNSASSGTITYLASDFDSSSIAPFTIKSNSCLAPLAGRKKCTISFSISNASSLPEPQTISSLFKVRGVDINLSAILDKDNTDYDAPVANITVTPSFLNFGTFKVGEFKELSLVVKNTALTGSTPITVGSSSNPNIVVSSNLCPTNLANRSSCSIKLKYTGVAAETFANENLIKIANNQITYSGTVTSPSVEEPEVLQIEPAMPSTNVAINQPDIQTGSIVFNNTGTLPLVAPVSGVSSDDGVVINSITCLGGLARSKSCTVNYTINSPALPSGLSVQTIKLQSGTVASESFSLNFDVVPNILPCTLADLSMNGVSVLNSNSSFVGNKVGADVSQCLLASNACNQYYSLATDSKSCQPVISACLPADAQTNGWNTNQALTISGSRAGGDISSCAVATCNNEYLLNVSGKTCDGVACSLVNAQGNGVSSILNVATVSGNINDDSCLVATCDQYYKNALDNKSCSPKLCTELNGTELSSLGYNLTGATISGTYNSCTVSCNSSLQQVAVDGKSCEDKTPSGTISFAAEYTKILTPNVVNLTSTNAQSIQFYSDAGCTATAGTAIALPLASTNLTLSPGDGTKTAYAKFINGTLSSACMSDTIILDQTLPALAVTAPASGANIAGNSLIISGTCSEVNASTVQVSVTLNGVTQNVNCASGLFSSSFNITAVPVASQTISLSATDLAENIGTATSQFNRINCTSFQDVVGNDCVDLDPTGTITFAQNHTKLLTSNVLNITSSNAQQLQLYSDASCITTIGSSLSLPLTNTTVNIGSGDGTKNIYGKFFNGSKSSSCFSDTITLDQTNPAVSIVTPTAGQSINTVSTNITGTCSDSLSGIASIDILVTGLPLINSTCSGGAYTSVVDISSLSNGNVTITVTATDNANNSSQSSVIFSKIPPEPVVTLTSAHRGFNGQIRAIKVLADGSMILGGNFTKFVDSSGVIHNVGRIAKLNAAGVIDTVFKNNTGYGFDSVVNSIVTDSGGNIYVGGSFNSWNGNVYGTAPRLAKLSATGIMNTAFISALGSTENRGPSTTVNVLAIDSSNNVYVGGTFIYWNNVANAARYIAKISSGGTADPTFRANVGTTATSGFDNQVTGLVVDSLNSSIYVGGYFFSWKGVAGNARTIAKLSTTGNINTTFQSNIGTDALSNSTFYGGHATALTRDSSNNVYLAGNMSGYQASTGTSASYFAKCNSNGLCDPAFSNAGVYPNAYSLTADSSGNIYVGGTFTSSSGAGTNGARRIMKVLSTGFPDLTFRANVGSGVNSGFDNDVRVISLDSSNNVLVGGAFTSYKNKSANFFQKIDSSGNNIDFLPSVSKFNGEVSVITKDNLNNTYVAGNFTRYNGVEVNRLAKFDSSGEIDTSFQTNIGSGPDVVIRTMDIDSLGNIYVGGLFATWNGVSITTRIIKLDPSGTVNNSFKTNIGSGFVGINSWVNAIVIDASDNIYVGGSFSSWKGVANSAKRVAKLDVNGNINPIFQTNIGTTATAGITSGEVFALELDNSGNLYVGGSFTSLNSVANSARYLTKLNSDGVIDPTFKNNYGIAATSGANNVIRAIAVDSLTSSLYVGGEFTSFNGGAYGTTISVAKLSTAGVHNTSFGSAAFKTLMQSANGLYDLLVDSSGNIYIAGQFMEIADLYYGQFRPIVKASATGNLDTTFQTNILGTSYHFASDGQLGKALYIDIYNNLYLGGIFNDVDNTPQSNFHIMYYDGSDI